MGDHCDSTPIEAVLDEQATAIPHGVLGYIKPPEVTIQTGLPANALGLLKDCMAGDLDSFEFASKSKAVRRQIRARPLEVVQ